VGRPLPERQPAEAADRRAAAARVGDGGGGRTPDWLFEECYHAVGDLAETITLLLPAPERRRTTSRCTAGSRSGCSPAGRGRGRASARGSSAPGASWRGTQLFVWNKLITGGFRVGVSQRWWCGRWRGQRGGRGDGRAPADGRLGADAGGVLRALFAPETGDADISPGPTRSSSPTRWRAGRSARRAGEWQVEWKWDGIRAQLIRRRGADFLWSRGEELVTERFPELAEAAPRCCRTARCWTARCCRGSDGAPLPFAQLQRRIGRKTLGRRSWPRCRSCCSLRPAGGRGRTCASARSGAAHAAGGAARRRPGGGRIRSRRRCSTPRGRRRPPRTRRARAGRGGADAQAARRRRTAWGGGAATGGSGR
jgi:hypothetical protein